MKHLEAAEQTAYVAWCRTTPATRLVFAIPNGGKRSILEAVRLRKEGVLPGVPDLMLPVACGQAHGLFVEMKSLVGVLSADQREMLELLAASGYAVAACWGAVQAIALTEQYLRGELLPGVYLRKPLASVKTRSPRRCLARQKTTINPQSLPAPV